MTAAFVVDLLRGLGVPESSAQDYAESFRADGFDCEVACLTLTAPDLERFAVKLGHRRLILQWISERTVQHGECTHQRTVAHAADAKSIEPAPRTAPLVVAAAHGKRRRPSPSAEADRRRKSDAATTATRAATLDIASTHAASTPQAEPVTPTANNERLAEIFEEMAVIQKLKRDFFRSRAYEQAAHSIRGQREEILSGAQARKIEGIGSGMARRIDIVLATGELEELKDLQKDDDVVAVRSLKRVHGIGLVRATKLIEQGIRSLAALRAAVADGTVRLDAAQTLGLAHAEEFGQKIPRVEMLEHERLLLQMQAARHPEVQGVLCGSFRRMAQASGDIDFLITTPGYAANSSGEPQPNAGELLRAYLQTLKEIGYITGDLLNGSTRYMGVCRLPGPGRLHRRIDVRCFRWDHYAFGTLYFTGSKALSIRMRLRAMELGMTLNEYGLTNKDGVAVKASTESEIFEALGMEYLEPSER